MSFTNKTPNLNLPQWQDTDEPTWLVDMNNAFSDIDSAVHANQQGNEGNEAQINALATQLTSTVEKVDKTVEDLGNDHALLVQIDAQHKINTQHIADLQEDLNGEVSNREAADTALEGKIAQNTTGITQNTDNIGALQGQVTELTAKVEQQGTEVEQFDVRLNTQDEAITGIQTNVTALQSGQEEVTAKVTEIQTDVTNNMGDVSALQADNTQNKQEIRSLSQFKPFGISGYRCGSSIQAGVIQINTLEAIGKIKQMVIVDIGFSESGVTPAATVNFTEVSNVCFIMGHALQWVTPDKIRVFIPIEVVNNIAANGRLFSFNLAVGTLLTPLSANVTTYQLQLTR